MGPRGLRWNPTTAHPTGEESSRRGRPPVRLAPKPALGATARLGSEVAAARAPGRVLRAATRLSPPRPGATTSEPAEAIARSVADAPAPPPAPAAERSGDEASGRGSGEATPVGMADWQAAWILGGDAEKAIEMSADADRPGGCQPRLDAAGRRALAAAAQPRRAHRRGAGVGLAGAGAATGSGGRPRGRRADAAARCRARTLAALVPLPAPRKRVARSPAGSAHSEPVRRHGQAAACRAASIMRSARPPSLRGGEPATPARAAGGERPAPVKLELRRRESAPVSEPVRPRMQRAARGSVQAASVTVPVADIVVPEQVEKPGVFRRAIDALTGRGRVSATTRRPGPRRRPPAPRRRRSAARSPPPPHLPSVSGPQSSASAAGLGERTALPGPGERARRRAGVVPHAGRRARSAARNPPPFRRRRCSGPGRRRSPVAPPSPPAPSRPRPSPHRSTALHPGGTAVARTPVDRPVLPGAARPAGLRPDLLRVAVAARFRP